jgi:hypothetical protein
MNLRAILAASAVFAFGFLVALAYARTGRPEWDQKKAEAIVKRCVELEKTGQPWDNIAWLTDPDEAARRARDEDRPILVYVFVKNKNGPAAAPC